MTVDPFARAVAAASARPGLSYAALAREIGGRRATALALLREAVTSGRLHEAESRVPAGPSAATRSVLGLFPGPAPQEAPPEPSAAAELLDLRQQLDLSAAQVAAQLGISPGLLYHWEAGRQSVPTWAARALPAALELAQSHALLSTQTRPRARARRRELLRTIEARPGLTRQQLTAAVGIRSRSTLRERLEPLLAAGRAHEAPAGAGRALGLFPGPAPLPVPTPTAAELHAAAQRAGWPGRRVARALGIAAPTWHNCARSRPGSHLANLVTPERVTQVMEELVAAGDALERNLLADMPATREALTRGRYGRSSVVESALDRLLAAGRAHYASSPYVNASGVTRHLAHLHPGPGPQSEPLSGEDLRELRQSRGLTRPTLGAALGLSDTQLGHWENGHQPIPASRAAQLRAHLEPLPLRENGRARMRSSYTDAEVEAAALAYVAEHPGASRRIVASAMLGTAPRRWETLARLVEEGRLREEPGTVRGKPAVLLHLP